MTPVSVHKIYTSVVEAFPRVAKTLFQKLNMPDDSWNTRGLDIPLRRPAEIFIPNVCAIDMDTMAPGLLAGAWRIKWRHGFSRCSLIWEPS
jgi:hypothetical protein